MNRCTGLSGTSRAPGGRASVSVAKTTDPDALPTSGHGRRAELDR